MREGLLRTLPAAAMLALLAGCLMVPGAGAERTGGGGVVVSFNARISPHRLPRHRPVPIALTLEGAVAAETGAPPRLTQFDVAFGARGGLDTVGLPTCSRAQLRNATRAQALARCRAALVGGGAVAAEVPLNPAEPLLAHARALAFNGRFHGRPAVWVHAYSSAPPVSFVLPFYLRRPRAGAYGVLLHSPIARALGRWPRLRSFRFRLGRRYRAGGDVHSYLSAACALPPSFHAGYFPLGRATYEFAPHPTLSTTILRRCRVRE